MAFKCEKCGFMWKWRPDIEKGAFSFAECIFEPFEAVKKCPACANPENYSGEVINTCLNCNKQFREPKSLNSLYCPECTEKLEV